MKRIRVEFRQRLKSTPKSPLDPPFSKGEFSPVLTLTPLSKEGKGRFFGANDAEIVQTLLTHHVYIPGSLTPIGGFATFLVISSTSHKFENFKARGQWL